MNAGWQEVLITDVTRMKDETVCIAALASDFTVVRPELPPTGIARKWLFQQGKQIIYPRAVVRMELKALERVTPPHLEDCHWVNPETTEYLRETSDERWAKLLFRQAFPAVRAAFETEILENRMLRPQTGARSLAFVADVHELRFEVTQSTYEVGKLDFRLFFKDATGIPYSRLPITDLTLRQVVNYRWEVESLSLAAISDEITQMLQEKLAYLRLGVGRPFLKNKSSDFYCYLQVNGIYTIPDYLRGAKFEDYQIMGDR